MLSYFFSTMPLSLPGSSGAGPRSDPALLSPLLASQPTGSIEKGGVLSIGGASRTNRTSNGWNVFRRYGSTDDEEKWLSDGIGKHRTDCSPCTEYLSLWRKIFRFIIPRNLLVSMCRVDVKRAIFDSDSGQYYLWCSFSSSKNIFIWQTWFLILWSL